MEALCFLFFLFIVLLISIIVGFKLRKWTTKTPSWAAFEVALVCAAGIFFKTIIIIMPAGTVGVVDFLGMVSDNTLKPGINIVNPFASVTNYSFKTQEIQETMTVPSQEGLTVELELSLLYNLDPEKANEVYKSIEEGDYLNVVLIPQFRSVVRGVTSKFDAKALYTASRDALADMIIADLGELVGPRGVTVESAALRKIVLPPTLSEAIIEKLQSEQESQKMQFILKKEEQEAERKRIEARGIADFQTIVSEGINEQLLKWKGIEATVTLAEAPNSKIVIIGSGKDGLPIILGNN